MANKLMIKLFIECAACGKDQTFVLNEVENIIAVIPCEECINKQADIVIEENLVIVRDKVKKIKRNFTIWFDDIQEMLDTKISSIRLDK